MTKKIALAKQAFQNQNQLLTNKPLSIGTHKGLVRTFVWSMLPYIYIYIYSSETWTNHKKRNNQVLEQIREKRQLVNMVKSRKIKLNRHKIRHHAFITNIFEGKVTGKKLIRHPRKEYFEHIQERYAYFVSLKNEATN